MQAEKGGKTGKVISSIFILIFGAFFIFASYVFFKNSKIDLIKYQKIQSYITDRGEEEYHVSGKGGGNFQRFYILLWGSDTKFWTHRKNNDFSELYAELKIGDSVKVYYNEENNSLLCRIIQIEKKGKIVIDKKEEEGMNKTIGFLCLLFGLFFWGYPIVKYNKNNSPASPSIIQ